MSTQEVSKTDAVPTSADLASSGKVEEAKDVKRELADAEVGAIRGGQNSHNSPPATNGIPR